MRRTPLIPSLLLQYKPDGLTRCAHDMNCSFNGSYVKREAPRHHRHLSIETVCRALPVPSLHHEGRIGAGHDDTDCPA